VVQDDIVLARLLIEKGADLETEAPIQHDLEKSAGTPLTTAVVNENLEMVRVLVESGANPNAPNGYGRVPLHFAAEGDTKPQDIALYLIQQGANVSAKTPGTAWTVLHSASAHGSPTIIRAILDAGVSIEIQEDEHGRTPLLLACEFKRPENVRCLLERGATVESRRADNSRTPLIVAAGRISVRIVTDLLDSGANISAVDAEDHTALHQACTNAHVNNDEDLEKVAASLVEILKTLLSRGAEIDARSDYQHTPLHLAAYYGHTSAVAFLLDSGASMTALSKNGYTPLMLAAGADAKEAVELLLARGAPMEDVESHGKTALSVAISWDAPHTAMLLIEREASISVIDNDGFTPLHEAAVHGFSEVISSLLKHDASINAETTDGYTALDYAVKYNKEECRKVLVEHGARRNRLSEATIQSTDAPEHDMQVPTNDGQGEGSSMKEKEEGPVSQGAQAERLDGIKEKRAAQPAPKQEVVANDTRYVIIPEYKVLRRSEVLAK
jgi:ankyrin